jgi:enamine deaminase RidA (YjgF/YER057c/UK114 family)
MSTKPTPAKPARKAAPRSAAKAAPKAAPAAVEAARARPARKRAAAAASAAPAVEYINPPGACPAQGLYSHIGKVSSGSLLFVAGQLSVGANGEVVGAHDFDRQFRQVFSNLGDVLKGMGLTYNDVVKFTTYLVHSQDIPLFMKRRAALFPRLFKGPLYPPNTLLIVDRLVKEEFVIEVEAIVRGND